MNKYCTKLTTPPIVLNDARITNIFLSDDTLTFCIPDGIMTATSPEWSGPAQLILHSVQAEDILCIREVCSSTRRTKRRSVPDFGQIIEQVHTGKILLEVLMLHMEYQQVRLRVNEFDMERKQYTAEIEFTIGANSLSCIRE